VRVSIAQRVAFGIGPGFDRNLLLSASAA
jgi:hypothetical protein